MNPLETYLLHCPSCGEPLEILIDLSIGAQRYVEDCAVCCAPMVVTVTLVERDDDLPYVTLAREDDA